jgi:predicted GIY-YIG superfamily endonuclease
MSWSKWYPFDEVAIETYAPPKEGIYRIKLKDHYFHLINKRWQGPYQKFSNLDSALKQKEPVRVRKNVSIKIIIYTDLIYIGKSENIRNRLLQHLKGNGNSCIYKLLNQSHSLEFSYLRRTETDYHQAEKNFFKSFIQETGGFCPPCDCCSNECQSKGGNCIPTYIGTLKIC